jgi:hypothetical protein
LKNCFLGSCVFNSISYHKKYNKKRSLDFKIESEPGLFQSLVSDGSTMRSLIRDGTFFPGSIVARTLANDRSRIGVNIKRDSKGLSSPSAKLMMDSEKGDIMNCFGLIGL